MRIFAPNMPRPAQYGNKITQPCVRKRKFFAPPPHTRAPKTARVWISDKKIPIGRRERPAGKRKPRNGNPYSKPRAFATPLPYSGSALEQFSMWRLFMNSGASPMARAVFEKSLSFCAGLIARNLRPGWE